MEAEMCIPNYTRPVNIKLEKVSRIFLKCMFINLEGFYGDEVNVAWIKGQHESARINVRKSGVCVS